MAACSFGGNMQSINFEPRHAMKTEAPDLLASYLERVGRRKLLAPEGEIDLGIRVRAGDRAARKELVERTLRLVASVPRNTAAWDCLSRT